MELQRRLRRIAALAASLLVMGGTAAAHERWVHHRLLRPYDKTYFTEPRLATVLVALTALSVILGTLYLSRRWRPRPPGFFRRLAVTAPTVLRVTYGATLLMFARRGAFLAPDLRIDGSLEGRILAGTAAVLGILLVFGFHVREASLLSLVAFAFAAIVRPFAPYEGQPIRALDVLAYTEVLGIAAYLVVAGRDVIERGRVRYDLHRAIGLSLLRGLLGVTLLFLGSLKFLLPDLFMGVVQNHPQVFLQPFERFGANAEVVVLGASAVEITLGTLILCGLYTRLCMIVLGSVFLTTAVIFKHELLGHLPFVGTIFVLFIEGGGSIADVRRERRRVQERMEDPLIPVPAPDGLNFSRRGATGIAAGALLVGLAFGETAPSAKVLDASANQAQALATAAAMGSLGGATTPQTPGQSTFPHAKALGSRGRVMFTADLPATPLELNQLFSLSCGLLDPASGKPMDGLDLVLDVTMPAHGHGMPTRPAAHRVDGGGFVVDGCQLSMFGAWRVQLVAVDRGSVVDLIDFPLTFEPTAP